jgi:hypothetical protein
VRAIADVIGLREWEPTEGLPALAMRLKLEIGDEQLAYRDESRLRSLLTALEHASAVKNLDFGLGLTTGLILGGVIGLLVGIFLLPEFNPDADAVRNGFNGTFAGLLLGAVVGAVVSVILGQRNVPFKRLKRVTSDYQLSVSALEEFAVASKARVRNAVRRLRDELAFKPLTGRE